jgi:hypothetical protein
MSPKPKPVPKRLGPPPQLLYGGPGLKGDIFSKIPMVQQQRKLQPKMHEIMSKQAKMIARWLHENLTWKKILMTWMVVLVASKMVLLMLTFEYFSLTALISLQIFHGVWTIAFFCLNVIDSRAILPNASCLLAGYLPATTVLHILLIPNDYPLEFIIVDAVGTFLAIITMFLLLRMECTEILHEAEELWQRQSGSDASSEVGSISSGSLSDGGCMTVQEMALPSPRYVHTPSNTGRNIAMLPPSALAAQHVNGIHGNRIGPTIITVNGVSHAAGNHHNLDSLLYTSMDEPQGDGGVVQPQPNGGHGMHSNGGGPSTMHSNVLGPCVDMGMAYDEAIDLEPIDFEHFVDEPDLGRQRSERMFRVSFGDSPPPPRGR